MSRDVPTVSARYRGRPLQLSFRWRNHRVVEETTGIVIPSSSASYIIGRDPEPRDSSRSYYFDAEGRPTSDTIEKLEQEFCIEFFVQFGRIYTPPQRQIIDRDDKSEWEAALDSHGLGHYAGLQPGERFRTPPNLAVDDEAIGRRMQRDEWSGSAPDPSSARDRRRRNVITIPRSAWRRGLVVRLSLVFPARDRRDPLIFKMAEFLSRYENWHEWWFDPELATLRSEIRDDSWKGAMVRALESAAFRRALAHRAVELSQETAEFAFRHRGIRYRFVVRKRQPNETEAGHERKVKLLMVLSGVKYAFKKHRRVDATVLAAAVHIAQRVLVEPEELANRRLVHDEIAKVFGLTPRQIRSMVSRIRCSLDPPHKIADLVNRGPGRPTANRNSPRFGHEVRASIQVPASPEGRAAMAERAERMIDEANRLEHSWSRSPDMSAKPPGPRTIHKARRLRKDGIAILNRLKDTAPPISD